MTFPVHVTCFAIVTRRVICTYLELHQIPRPDIMAPGASISYMLSLPPIRTRVLHHLSAYDAAKLDSLCICILRRLEKKMYLDPARDIIQNVIEMQLLIKEGMQLLLIGNDVAALFQRLRDTREYLKKNGARRLTIYLVGTFPLRASATIKDRLIRFSPIMDSNDVRSSKDRQELRVLDWAMGHGGSDRKFIMSFNMPLNSRQDTDYGVWHQIHGIPEKTIDLRVYVPSFRDRSEGVCRFRATDVVRLLASDRLVLRHVREIILALMGKQKLRADDLIAPNTEWETPRYRMGTVLCRQVLS